MAVVTMQQGMTFHHHCHSSTAAARRVGALLLLLLLRGQFNHVLVKARRRGTGLVSINAADEYQQNNTNWE
jgi:hypothetical protein